MLGDPVSLFHKFDITTGATFWHVAAEGGGHTSGFSWTFLDLYPQVWGEFEYSNLLNVLSELLKILLN